MVNESRILKYQNITDTAAFLALGYTKDEICEKLGISPRTFSCYMKRMREMGLIKKTHGSDAPMTARIDFDLLAIMSNGLNVIFSEDLAAIILPCNLNEL